MAEIDDQLPAPNNDLSNAPKDWVFSIDGEYRFVDRERLDELARDAEVIIVNDDHPSSFMHTDWVELIRRLRDNGSNPSVLFEMIRDDFQDGLSRYAQGEMSEEQFRREVYDQSWDWDYRRYKPYFQLVRDLNLPAVAADLNKTAQ